MGCTNQDYFHSSWELFLTLEIWQGTPGNKYAQEFGVKREIKGRNVDVIVFKIQVFVKDGLSRNEMFLTRDRQTFSAKD